MQLAIRSTVVEEETGHPAVTSVSCASMSIAEDGTLTAFDENEQVVHTAPAQDWDFVRVNKPI